MRAKSKKSGDKNKILKELKVIKGTISKKDSEIDKSEIELMQKIDKTFSEEKQITAKISSLQGKNKKLKTENKNFLKKYNEYLQNKNHLTKEYKINLSSLKKMYQQKLKEKGRLMKKVKEEYDLQKKKLGNMRKQLVLGQKKGWSIWKRLGLKERYDVENKEKEEEIRESIDKIKEDFKVLLDEKARLDKEYKEKKENIAEVLLTKKNIQKQKYIFDKIKKNKQNIIDLERKSENNEETLEKLKSGLEKLEKEKETLQQKWGDKEKFLDLIPSISKLKLTKKTRRLKPVKPEVEAKKEEIRPIIVLGETKTDFSKIYEDLEEQESAKEEEIEQAENVLQLGKKPGAVRRCERLIEDGNKALEEGNLKNAIKIFDKLERKYSNLPNIQKLAISNEFGLFKEKLNQKYQLEEDESLLNEKLY